MRILIIKTSSLGDVIHTLPALMDAKRAYPNAQFDWLVEKNFSEIPLTHPQIQKVYTLEWRKWVKTRDLYSILNFLVSLRKLPPYDLIIDAQGLIKSALMARMIPGKRHGFDRKSVKEPFASVFYHRAHFVPKTQHAVERTRQLFAKVLDYPYPLDQKPEYGYVHSQNLSQAPSKNLVFFVNTTWDSKHWPEAYWRELALKAIEAGFTLHITSGNFIEWQRILRISKGLSRTICYPTQSITNIKHLLENARGVVTVDTGLGHLSAALNLPTIALFGSTDPVKSKPYSLNTQALQADRTQFPCSPCFQKQCTHPNKNQILSPPCYQTLTPDQVWKGLSQKIY